MLTRILSPFRVTLTCLLWAWVSAAAAQASEATSCVINVKPPSVAVLDAKLKLVGSVPIGPDPSSALLGPGNRFLYVLHNGFYRLDGGPDEAKGDLAILDVESRTAVKKVPLGWNTTGMWFSRGGRHLICFSAGRKNKKEPQPAVVTIIDTQTNEVAATRSTGLPVGEARVTGDASKIFVLDRVEKKDDTPSLKPAITIFTLAEEKPLARIEMEGSPEEMALSGDEKWLYVLDRGKKSRDPQKRRNGAVYAVDVEGAKLAATHDVGEEPAGLIEDPKTGAVTVMGRKLYRLLGGQATPVGELGDLPLFVKRLGDLPGTYVVTHEEMRFLPDEGGLAPSPIALNHTTESIGGSPQEMLYLPQLNKAFFGVRSDDGKPSSKVALVNLKENRVEKVLKTGRKGAKFGRMLAGAALSAAMTGLSYSAASPGGYYNVYSFGPLGAQNAGGTAVSPDGRFAYGLNTFTKDVTIIDAQAGTVIQMLPIEGQQMLPAPGGKFLCLQAQSKITFLDMGTHKVTEQEFVDDKLHTLNADEVGSRIIVLTGKSLLAWDAVSGASVANTRGLSEPRMWVSSFQDSGR